VTTTEELSDRLHGLSASKRRRLSLLLQKSSWDTSWLDEMAQAPAPNPVEEILLVIWKQVLGVETVGIQDDFFDLGGDSILSIRIVARAQEKGLSFTSRQLFEHPTVAALAVHVEVAGAPEQEPEVLPAVPHRAEGARLSPGDFPDAELTQPELDRVLEQVSRGDSYRPELWLAEGSSRHRMGGEPPRVLVLRSARF